MSYKMIINTYLTNKSSIVQDINILSEQIPTNITKNTPNLMPFKNNYMLDEMACLHRHARVYIGTSVSGQAQGVSLIARTVLTSNLYRAQAGNKVDIYKKLN